MGKQIQIVGMNAPFEEKALDLETGNQFTFTKPAEGDEVEIGDLNFIRAIKNIDNFRNWVVNYKRDDDTIIPLKIDKIEKKIITPVTDIIVELNIDDISAWEYGTYKYIDLDGQLVDVDASVRKYVYVSKSYGPGPSVYYGVDSHGSTDNTMIALNFVSAGEIELNEIDDEQTESSYAGAVTRLISANKDGNKVTLTLRPFDAVAQEEDGEEESTTEWNFHFTNDDVDVSSITLVKLDVVYKLEENEIVATYTDETKEIEAGTVLPTPSGSDNGKFLGVDGGEYALVDSPIPAVETTDKNKYLHTNSGTGALEWSEVSGGLPTFIVNDGSFTTPSLTWGAFKTLVGDAMEGILLIGYEVELGNRPYRKFFFSRSIANGPGSYRDCINLFDIAEFGGRSVGQELQYSLIAHEFLIGDMNDSTDLFGTTGYIVPKIPSIPNDASTKTYVLKLVNGTPTWVEEQAQ